MTDDTKTPPDPEYFRLRKLSSWELAQLVLDERGLLAKLRAQVSQLEAAREMLREALKRIQKERGECPNVVCANAVIDDGTHIPSCWFAAALAAEVKR